LARSSFGEDAGDVGLDGPFAEEEALSDAEVRATFGHQGADLALAGCQEGEGARDKDLRVPRYVAEVVFAFEMEDITAGGQRLRELADLASRLGFAMRNGEVREAPPDPSSVKEQPLAGE
jgi:hypothetical protein